MADEGATSMLLRRELPPTFGTKVGSRSASNTDISSGADIGLIDGYLQQLLPALAKTRHGEDSSSPEGSLEQLGLSRGALLAAGLPQHTINALYRAMAGHAGAFRKMVAGEVRQLRTLLAHHAAPQLSSTIELLDYPVLATGPAATANKALKAAVNTGSAASVAMPALTAASSVTAARRADPEVDLGGLSDRGLPAGDISDIFDALTQSCLGPTANELVKDYAEAYASMKENMEIRLRHELRRGDHYMSKLQDTEAQLKDALSQLDAAHKKSAVQQTEHEALSVQHAGLQQSAAVSHAAHLALQQQHQTQMAAWKAERHELKQQHKQELEALQAELASSSATAAALVEANRQTDALRMLYNEELGRASKLALELSKATAAVDKAAAQEALWAKQVAASDCRADHAQGMAVAMDVSVKQLEAELQQRQQEIVDKEADALKLRLMLERSRLKAVVQAAEARATKLSLDQQLEQVQAQLSERTAALTTANDHLKMCKMELQGANAQHQAGRSHVKQLMSDLEGEQERCASLAAALEDTKVKVSNATSAAEVAEARLKTAQEQLVNANDAAMEAHCKLSELRGALEEQAAIKEALKQQCESANTEYEILTAEAGRLKDRLSELINVQQDLAQLQAQHQEVTACFQELQEQNEVLSSKAEQLLITTFELQELKQQHFTLEETQKDLQQNLAEASHNLLEARAAGQASDAQVKELQKLLDEANLTKAQLARELAATSAAGDTAQHEAVSMAQQLDDLQTALEAAEMDRQALAAQRDGWMASFQEAYGKLQEWTVSSEAAAHKLASRAGALQGAMQAISSQAQASAAAEDKAAARSLAAQHGSPDPSLMHPASTDSTPSAAATSDVLDQLSALQHLLRAEASKQQELFDHTLKALQDRVQERHHAAQASWQGAMSAVNKRRAARATAKAAERNLKTKSLAAVAATNSHAAYVASAAMADHGRAPPAVSTCDVAENVSTADETTVACAAGRSAEPTDSVEPCCDSEQPAQDCGKRQTENSKQLAAALQVDRQRQQCLQQHQHISSELLGSNHQLGGAARTLQAQGQPQDTVKQQSPNQQESMQQQALEYKELQQQHHKLQQQYAALLRQHQQQQQQHDSPMFDNIMQQPPDLPQPLGQSRQQSLAPAGQGCQGISHTSASPGVGMHCKEVKHPQLQQPRINIDTADPAHAQAAPKSEAVHRLPMPVRDSTEAFEASSGSSVHDAALTACVVLGDTGSSQTCSAISEAPLQPPVKLQADGCSSTDSGRADTPDMHVPLPVVLQRLSSTQCVTHSTTITIVSTSTSSTQLAADGQRLDVNGCSRTSRHDQELAACNIHHQRSAVNTAAVADFASDFGSLSHAVPTATTILPWTSATKDAVPAELQGKRDEEFDASMLEPRSDLQLVASSPRQSGCAEYPHSVSASSAAMAAVSHGLLHVPGRGDKAAATNRGVAQGLMPTSTLVNAAGHPLDLNVASASHDSFTSGDGTNQVNSPVAVGAAGGASLLDFVSLATYQEQMQSVAKLHGQVGQLAVQLREAHADAQGAQQLLQQERQETVTRTAALREALGQLHGQLEELREDHKQLQETHRSLVTKDLTNAGLLRDKYVADLFQRLQEALWKLDTARQRAATWGFDMLVPLGRTNRGIQTQAGEIWAMTGVAITSLTDTYHTTKALSPGTNSSATGCMSLVGNRVDSTWSAPAHDGSLIGAGADLSAETEPVASVASIVGLKADASAGMNAVHRKAPAFTQHTTATGARRPGAQASQKAGASLAGNPAVGVHPADAENLPAAAGNHPSASLEEWLWTSAVKQVAGGGISALPLGDVLRLIASFCSAKATADARLLCCHSSPSTMWEYLCKHLLNAGIGTQDAAGHSSAGSSQAVMPLNKAQLDASAALAQLLHSLETHAGVNRDVMTFQAQLLSSISHKGLSINAAEPSHVKDTTPVCEPSGLRCAGCAEAGQAFVGCLGHGDTSTSSQADTAGSWDLLRIDNDKLLPFFHPGQLLPDALPRLLYQLLAWPGMSALLSWVAGGYFLGGLKPDDLGKPLLDVQAPHIHFMLLEAADILRIHPLPKVHVAQGAAPSVRLVRVPMGHAPHYASARSSVPSSQMPAALKCQYAYVLVLSSAAMQMLKPKELQAAMSNALAPLACQCAAEECSAGDQSGQTGTCEPSGSACTSSGHGSSSCTALPSSSILADLATVASLLVLAPAFLLNHLPAEMHAMGGFLAAALLAVERMVCLAGDRASLLVCQNTDIALSTLLKTSGVKAALTNEAGRASMHATQQQEQQPAEQRGQATDTTWLVQCWQQRLAEQQQGQDMATVQQILPQHEKLLVAAGQPGVHGSTNSSKHQSAAGVGSSGSTAACHHEQDGQLSDEAVLLLRVQELTLWSESPQYAQLMSHARPLRRVVRPGSANSARCTKTP